MILERSRKGANDTAMLQIITANRLTDGRIVYRKAPGVWVGDIASAARCTTKEEAAAAMDSAKVDFAANLVVEIEAIEVKDGPGGLTAVTNRDRIRVAGGPTILVSAPPAGTAINSEQDDVSI